MGKKKEPFTYRLDKPSDIEANGKDFKDAYLRRKQRSTENALLMCRGPDRDFEKKFLQELRENHALVTEFLFDVRPVLDSSGPNPDANIKQLRELFYVSQNLLTKYNTSVTYSAHAADRVLTQKIDGISNTLQKELETAHKSHIDTIKSKKEAQRGRTYGDDGRTKRGNRGGGHKGRYQHRRNNDSYRSDDRDRRSPRRRSHSRRRSRSRRRDDKNRDNVSLRCYK